MRKKVGQLVQECYEKWIFIKIAVNADAVGLSGHSMTVVAKYALSFTGDGKMNFVMVEIV